MKAGLVALAAIMLAVSAAQAAVEIDITRGNFKPVPIAISDFDADNPQALKIGTDIAQVIRADLERSGLFKPVDPKAHIQSPAQMRVQPRFQDWRVINVDALVNGRIEMQADGRLRGEFRLWDVAAENQMTGLALFTTPDNWRRLAHLIADAIYKRVTGEDGYFDTRIVYVSESGPPDRRVKRLAIMDQDGANHRMLTDGRFLVLTPRFSPGQRNHLSELFQREAARLSVQYRYRTAGTGRRFSGHDLRAAFLAGRQSRDHVAGV